MYKLLVADDNKVGRDAIEYMLKANDLPFKVYHAKNGQEALQMITETGFDCVVTDIRMPRLTGIELIKKVSENENPPIFVICSGYREFEDAKAAIEYGVHNYLLKPLVIEDFLKTMNQIVELLREKKKKQRMFDSESTRNALFGRADTEGAEVKERFKSLRRLVAVSTAKILDADSLEHLHRRIEELENSKIQVLAIEKGWDLILYFADDSQNGEELNSLLQKIRSVYESFAGEPVFICVSRQVTELENLPNYVNDTMRCCERRFFSVSHKILYVEEEEMSCSERLDDLEKQIFKEITGNNYTEIEEKIINYLDLLAENNRASVVFTKFQVSNFVKAILQRHSLRSGSLLLRAVEDVGYATDINELKLTVSRFIKTLKADSPLSTEDSNAVEIAEKLIREEYAQELTLESIAQRVYLSPYYLSRVFKKKTGINLFSYLVNVRMEVSRDLLLNTQMKIADISRAVGYEDPSYFSRVFKQYYGVIPKKFRYINEGGN